MKEKALFYYHNGYNCTQCILKAASDRYCFPLPRELLNGCDATNAGFGVGSLCGVLVGAVMIFGILFPEERAAMLRLQLLSQFQEKWKSLNCCNLAQCCKDCDDIIADIAVITENLIAVEQGTACSCRR